MTERADLAAILAAHALTAPRDGDCEHVAAAVTAELCALGYSARTVLLWAWKATTGPRRELAFGHWVTVCEGRVLDGTARQFATELPAAWIAPTAQYLAELAAATGTARAELLGEPAEQ